MVGTLLTLMIIAGFALHQYIKGGIVKGFIFLMSAIFGAFAAFAYYELAAGYIREYDFIGPKAYPIAFFLLFALVFVLVREAAGYLLKPEISFGQMPDRAGGIAFGIIGGYIVAGAALIIIGLAPIKADWLYGRFGGNISNPPQPAKATLNPDGFVSGLFGMVSGGSLKGSNSFAVVHADYVNQNFLNCSSINDGISPIAADSAVGVTAPGIRPAAEGLMEAPKEDGQAAQPVAQEPGKTLMLVRLRVSPSGLAVPQGVAQSKLGMAQVRLVLKDKETAADLSSGSAEVAYPVGYINSAGQLKTMPLNASLDEADVKKGNLDFAFYVPSNSVPVLMECRQNLIERVKLAKPSAETPAAEKSAEPNT